MEYHVIITDIVYRNPRNSEEQDLKEITFVFDEEIDTDYLRDNLGYHIAEAVGNDPVSFVYRIE